jgi:hypothetical protein
VNENIKELKTNSKNKNIGDLYTSIKELKECYQPRTNLVKDENGYLLPDSHDIFNRWKKHFCELLNVPGINEVR